MFFRWLHISLLCVACVLLGSIIGWFIPLDSPLSPAQITSYRGAQLRQSNTNYQFIAPLLACDVGSEEAFPEFVPLKETLTNLINQKIAEDGTKNISVYLRSMVSARWFEIRGTLTYAPASLFKTFVMMAYYKEADETDNPGLLQQEIPFEGSATYGDDVVGGTILHLVNGKLYTIDQIIDQMIVYSDNDAFNTLLNHFDLGTLARLQTIFKDLNIPLPLSKSDIALNFMSVDEYAMVFRVLFGSTYLSERYSEKALQLLTQSKYMDGIVAGVPSGLTVAHKYGVLTIPKTATTLTTTELHDCGVIYYPKHPYLLCIMTNGNDLAGQQNSIKDISAAAYRWLDAYYKALPSSNIATSTSSTVTP
jgi:beta-lactamase class A